MDILSPIHYLIAHYLLKNFYEAVREGTLKPFTPLCLLETDVQKINHQNPITFMIFKQGKILKNVHSLNWHFGVKVVKRFTNERRLGLQTFICCGVYNSATDCVKFCIYRFSNRVFHRCSTRQDTFVCNLLDKLFVTCTQFFCLVKQCQYFILHPIDLSPRNTMHFYQFMKSLTGAIIELGAIIEPVFQK